MTSKTLFARVGLGGVVLAAALMATPAIASADPITDFLCSSGSAQFCPAPIAPLVAPAPAPQAAPQPVPAPSTFEYKNCTEARNAGAAPVLRGEYGYGAHLDSNNDGVGCE
nr:excalibur calcium-binding domain-containing protein [Rhodococcus sp. (in: high G+C Gram-positive bacteria)]